MKNKETNNDVSRALPMSAENGLPEIIDTGGRLHPFWDHSVLFIANLLALFFGNEDETRLLENEIQGADSYGGRLLPILNLLYQGGNNLLVLERAPDDAMQNYFVESLRLTLPEIEILSHTDYLEIGGSGLGLSSQFHRSEISFVDGYVTDSTLSAIAKSLDLPTVSSQEGSRYGNNKSLLHEALVSAGLPVFDTLHSKNPDQVVECISHLKSLGYRSSVIKSPLGASGIGIMKVGVDESFEVPGMMFFEGPCMVQGWLEPGVDKVQSITSPSVQMFLNRNQVVLYDVTDQILSDDSVHQGNESPPVYLEHNPDLRKEMLRQSAIAGRWLHAQGYRGTASVDFLVVHRSDSDEPTVYVCEINARVTGATYPSVLARHFRPDGAWLMRNVSLSQSIAGSELLERLDQNDRLFHAGARQGVLPINLNLGEDDAVVKGQFLSISNTVEECHALLGRAEMDLGVPWRYDRD